MFFMPQTIISVNQKEYKDNKSAFSIRRIVLKKTSASLAEKLLNFKKNISKFSQTFHDVWGIERSGFFNGREKWAKGFENQRV